MLYSNKSLSVIDREMPFGTLRGVALGELGRGRREVFLPTPPGVEGKIPLGPSQELTVGSSRSGRPKLVRAISSDNKDLYMILSSEDRYTRRGCGCIRAPRGQAVELIAHGNGADGDAGRIGTWDVIIVRAAPGDVFRVTWGGYGYGRPATFYLVFGGQVYVAEQPSVGDLYEALGLEVPFTLKYDVDGGFVIDIEEWKII